MDYNLTETYNETGFTIAELMVGLTLFSILSLGIATYLEVNMRRIGLEHRASHAAQEVQNAVALLTSEYQMSSVTSPYLPGIDSSLSACQGSTTASNSTLRFIVTFDDPDGTNGYSSYYVGYSYDADEQVLKRGAIPVSYPVNCTLPADDPTDEDNALILAANVVPVDSDGDGAEEPIFSITNNLLRVSLGTTITANSGEEITQIISTDVAVR